jgi:hypothetical protein
MRSGAQGGSVALRALSDDATIGTNFEIFLPMPTICTICAKDPALLRLLNSAGELLPQCSLCKSFVTKGMAAESPQLKALLRALVRLHFSEWDYNTHVGGDYITTLFHSENPILHHEYDPADIEDALLPSLEEGYQTADLPISLHAGYFDDIPNEPLEAMKAGIEHRLANLRERAANTNYFLLEADLRNLLEPHRAHLARSVPVNQTFYRARIGIKDRQLNLNAAEFQCVPFSDQEIGAPPQSRVGAGRLNRAGVSFLYLATEATTAINEVRPHPGHKVSIGAFHNMRALEVADFSALLIEDFIASDQTLDEYWMLRSIDSFFSVPVPPEERERYLLTQLLSDGVRHLGFDGVAYRSSVGAGVNYAFFDPQAFEYSPGSEGIVLIEGMTYSHRDQPVLPRDAAVFRIDRQKKNQG